MRRYKIISLKYPNSIKPIKKKLIALKSLTKLEIRKLSHKYDAEMLRIAFDIKTNIDIREQQIKELENKKICELALMFIINKPKMKLDNQIEWLKNFYAGWVIQIIESGYQLSNL